MRLPNAEDARVDREKLTDYLLCVSHPDGASKAEFFARLGFRLEDWAALADALRIGSMSFVFKAAGNLVGEFFAPPR